MLVSSVGSSDPSRFYSNLSTGGSSSNTLSGTGLPTQDSVNLQLDSLLLQSLSQPSSSIDVTADYPTNMQQAVQDQTILETNPSLAQTLSQQAASPLLEPLAAALETLPAAGSSSSEPSITSLAASMQVLKNVAEAGTLKSNPSLAQSILQNYTTFKNIPSPGSLVDTSA